MHALSNREPRLEQSRGPASSVDRVYFLIATRLEARAAGTRCPSRDTGPSHGGDVLLERPRLGCYRYARGDGHRERAGCARQGVGRLEDAFWTGVDAWCDCGGPRRARAGAMSGLHDVLAGACVIETVALRGLTGACCVV
jgi:hypothetical protein